ncbi:MAG: peptide chain release factor N(5)-glutamine methyltransferase [Desulfatiglandales bacterium]|nr:peptide chain release factor N(5)-glutamine methyltransferase [Desulfatiglandales bacterium]
MSPKIWTIKELLKVTTDYLKTKKIDSPRLVAEILLAHQLNINRIKLYLNFDQPLRKSEITGYRSLITRRLGREPLQYIIGIQEFWSQDFIVGMQVMIPRPESELLVEQVISLCKGGRLPENQNYRILDLGTGSGVLAISLAGELEEASLWASDISRDALNLARLNTQKHGVEGRIEFCLGDMWQAFLDQDLKFDIILSNPPYIASEAIDTLPAEVRDYEPRLALDGREEGMYFISKIIMEGPKYLNPGGWLLLEMDPKQTTKAFILIEESDSYKEKVRLKDFSNRYRVVMAKKK